MQITAKYLDKNKVIKMVTASSNLTCEQLAFKLKLIYVLYKTPKLNKILHEITVKIAKTNMLGQLISPRRRPAPPWWRKLDCHES